MKKNKIKLTESQLHQIIKESVTAILKEYGESPETQRQLGRVAGRSYARYCNDVHAGNNMQDSFNKHHPIQDQASQTALKHSPLKNKFGKPAATDEYNMGFWDEYLNQCK